MPTRLRPSDYGARLRLPQDRTPRLNGTNQWAGTNQFDQLYARNLWVQENLTIYDADVDVSAGASAQLGTEDAQDFWLKANSIARLGVTSGGVYLLTSSQPSSIFATTQADDAFNRADENPAVGWTPLTGFAATAGIRVSANAAVGATSGGALNAATINASPWSATVQSVQALIRTSAAATAGQIIGILGFAASSGPSAYGLIADTRSGGLTGLQFYKLRSSAATGLSAIGNITVINTGTPTTVKLSLSAGTTAVGLSAFLDGAFTASDTDGTNPLLAGYGGVFAQTYSGGPVASGTSLDDFVMTDTTAPPFSAGDLVLQASASLWNLLATDGATKHAQVFTDGLHLGFDAPVVFTGLTSAFMSAGTSAYFNTATYGVVRLVSAVGTTGLSGVVQVSGGTGVTVSAVGTDLILVSGAGDQGSWGFRNLRGGNLGLNGVSASANMWYGADRFTVQDSNGRLTTGTSLAVSCNVTVSGANGRDVSASFPAPSWVHFYAISGANGVAALASSAVPSAGPVLPAGYSAVAYTGPAYMDSASALRITNTHGPWAFYYPSNVQVLAAGAATVETAIDLSTTVPPNAPVWDGSMAHFGTANAHLRESAGVNWLDFDASVTERLTFLSPNVGQQILYITDAAGGALYVLVQGFLVPNGAT